MKKFSQKLIVLLLGLVLLFSVVPNSVTVSAASKNKVTTSISKVQSKAKGFKVTWKKKSKVKGYQIQYSTSKKFPKSKTKTKTVSSSKTTSATIKKLSGCGKKYYVRIRTYTVSNGKRVYSSWSSIKTVTTAKHKYEKATCTDAKTCKYCDKTSGKALGHKWENNTCTRCDEVKESSYGENYHGHVYTGGESSKKYHYEEKCAGKYSHEITWQEVTNRDLTPCKTCVE